MEVAFAKLNSTDTAASRFPDVGDVQSGVKQLLLPQAAAVQQVFIPLFVVESIYSSLFYICF